MFGDTNPVAFTSLSLVQHRAKRLENRRLYCANILDQETYILKPHVLFAFQNCYETCYKLSHQTTKMWHRPVSFALQSLPQNGILFHFTAFFQIASVHGSLPLLSLVALSNVCPLIITPTMFFHPFISYNKLSIE